MVLSIFSDDDTQAHCKEQAWVHTAINHTQKGAWELDGGAEENATTAGWDVPDGLGTGLMCELELEVVICITREVDYLPSSQRIKIYPNIRSFKCIYLSNIYWY